MMVSHKIQLDPNNVQATYFSQAAGTARFAYNWALDEWGRQYGAHLLDPVLPKPTEAALRRQLNAIKRAEFPWMLGVTKCAPQMAIIQLGRGFENFFAHRAAYPTYRCKGRDDRFTLTNDQFKVDGKRIHIPKLGWVRMRESLRFAGHIVSACVSRRGCEKTAKARRRVEDSTLVRRDEATQPWRNFSYPRSADRWYVSITVDTLEERFPLPSENQGAVGIDLGVSNLATLSTGEVITGPKALREALTRQRRLSRSLSRKQKGSRNRLTARRKLARQHARTANIRANGLHQVTTSIARRFHTIGIEDLHVKGILKNRCLSRAIADMGFGEFRRQLAYKAAWHGGQIVVVDRWYPSSKTCSCCGIKLDTLGLGQRQWTCAGCGTTHDRDLNAAINLRNMAVSSTVSACGGEGAGPAREHGVKPAAVKQELNGKASFK